ncbi:MAG: prepilin peptidase [Candidatus Anstonellaceae archaeon]
MLSLLPFPSTLPGAEMRIAAALVFTAIAAYFDAFNKKWVPNYVVYCFLATAFVLNLVYFEAETFKLALGSAAVIFAISFALYKLGQLGGADAYVLTAISLSVPYLPQPILSAAQQPPYPFILSVLAPTGFAFILHMLLRFIPYISKKISHGQVKFGISKLFGPALLTAAFAVFLSVMLSFPVALPQFYLGILSFLFLALIFFSLFKDEIKASMVEMVPTGKLQAEDVLALEQMDASLVKKFRLSALISEKTIAALRKSKLKKVPVYTGMPFFLPYLFFGLLVTILFGDVLSLLLIP